MANKEYLRRPSTIEMPQEDFVEIACAGAMLTALLSKMQMKIDELEKRVAQLEKP